MSAASIPRLGLVYGLSNTDYHAHPAVSKTGLDHIDRSPAHFRAYREEPQKETPALRFGAIVHAAVLEPETWTPMMAPDCQRRSNADKARWAEAEAEAAERGVDLITEAEREQVERMRDAVWAHRSASWLLSQPGAAEVSCFWQDQATGVECRCRPDRMPTALDFIADLKTCEDASPDAFRKSVANHRYHVQAAFYLDGVGLVAGTNVAHFPLIAVEKERPHGVAVYEIPLSDIEIGRAAYIRNLETLAECQRTGSWPCYPETIQTLSLPGWAKRN